MKRPHSVSHIALQPTILSIVLFIASIIYAFIESTSIGTGRGLESGVSSNLLIFVTLHFTIKPNKRYYSEPKTNWRLLERQGLEEAIAYVREGDTLVVWKLDRLGRSLPHLIETIIQKMVDVHKIAVPDLLKEYSKKLRNLK